MGKELLMVDMNTPVFPVLKNEIVKELRKHGKNGADLSEDEKVDICSSILEELKSQINHILETLPEQVVSSCQWWFEHYECREVKKNDTSVEDLLRRLI